MSFIKDFQRLLLKKPRYNVKHVMAENCDYSDTAIKSKNCYYSFSTFYCEDVYYGRYSRKCTSCSGVTFCVDCEWCTECVDCYRCYNVDYSQDCQNCTDCRFCKDCFGCTNCFGCVGLHQKKYRFFNEQLTKDDYQNRMQEINLQSQTHRDAVMQRMNVLRQKTPNLGMHQFQTENCTGEHISESSNCLFCFTTFASEDCLYTIETNGNKDGCDISVCFETELCYSCVQAPMNYNCNFLMNTDLCNDSEFCAYSKNLKNCFGCVYVQDKEYHILNKPYEPDLYYKTVSAIRKELEESGRYNMMLYFVSDYEKNRLKNETDSVIQIDPSILAS